jgi:hypothetical protein
VEAATQSDIVANSSYLLQLDAVCGALLPLSSACLIAWFATPWLDHMAIERETKVVDCRFAIILCLNL